MTCLYNTAILTCHKPDHFQVVRLLLRQKRCHSPEHPNDVERLHRPGTDVTQRRRHLRGRLLRRRDYRHGRRAVGQPGHRNTQQ